MLKDRSVNPECFMTEPTAFAADHRPLPAAALLLLVPVVLLFAGALRLAWG